MRGFNRSTLPTRLGEVSKRSVVPEPETTIQPHSGSEEKQTSSVIGLFRRDRTAERQKNGFRSLFPTTGTTNLLYSSLADTPQGLSRLANFSAIAWTIMSVCGVLGRGRAAKPSHHKGGREDRDPQHPNFCCKYIFYVRNDRCAPVSVASERGKAGLYSFYLYRCMYGIFHFPNPSHLGGALSSTFLIPIEHAVCLNN